MKRVITPLFLSFMLFAGWAQAQTSSSGGVRESTDPARAAEVEQRARELGDIGRPSPPSGGQSGAQSEGESGAASGAESGGQSVSPSDTGSGVPGPTGTEDLSGPSGGTGDSTGDSTGATAPGPKEGSEEGAPRPQSPGGTDEGGMPRRGTEAMPGMTGRSSGGNLKGGPEPGEMTGTEQLQHPQDRRFSEPTQPVR